MDKKGICVYLVALCVLAFGIVPALLHFNLIVVREMKLLNTVIFLLMLWFPAVAAWIALKGSPNSGVAGVKIWPVSFFAALSITLGVFFIFFLTHLLVALLGVTELQWGMGTLMNQIKPYIDIMLQQQSLPPTVAAIAPGIGLVGLLLLSLVLGPTVFAVMFLGTELGWRGYLLPRLMPLGRWPAYLITGALWALSYVPLIYSMHVAVESSTPFWSLLVRFALMMVILSVILGEVTRRTGHTGLAAIVLGAFVAQAYLLWRFLFPMSNEPWTGTLGVFSLLVWGIVALVIVFYTQQMETEGAADGE